MNLAGQDPRSSTAQVSDEPADPLRRRALGAVCGVAAGAAVTAADAAAELAPPRRALTGRDAAGKSVFEAFDVTPQVVTFDARPGLAFYELYATDGVPSVTGHEPDPMLTRKGTFPAPGATLFRMVQFPPRLPSGNTLPPEAYARYLEELDAKIPGMSSHFERDVPGMHTSDSVDYGVVVRGEIILELDDGKTVHLKQGDCVVQNGTRHLWRNPLAEPCLMAFVLIGGKRG